VFLRTLRFRVVFFYSILLVLIMLSFSTMLYQRQSQELHANLDNLLLTRAQGIVDAIDTFWEIEKNEAAKDGLNLDVLSKNKNINFSKIAQRWLHEKSPVPDLLNIIVQILNTEGNIIANSKNVPRTIISPQEIYKDALQGTAHFKTFYVSFEPETKMLLRAYTLPVFENNKVAYIVQVAGPLDKIQSALKSLKRILFVLFPITILIIGITGLILSNIILKPLNKMITTARKISANDLTSRIYIPKSKGELQRMAITFNDILDRIESTFLSQKRFVQDASHELKTPMTIMKGELEVALKRMRSVDEYVEILESILEEIDRLIRIKENLLTLTCLDEKKLTLDFKKFDIQLLLRDIVEDIKVLADRKKIGVQCDIIEETIISGDKDQLQQVFFNIFDNAVKYTPEGGIISLSSENSPDEVLIKIEDNGIGITSEDLPYIFNRFYRSDKSRSSEGSGLGLSISKSIVEAHKGSIAVSSTPDRVTIIAIFLPKHSPAN